MNNNCYNSIKQPIDEKKRGQCCSIYIPGPTGPTSYYYG